jgi:hypothetical protein
MKPLQWILPVFFLASSFLASSVSAQVGCPTTASITETWSSYCDGNGQAKARLAIRLIMLPGPGTGFTLPANADTKIGAIDVTTPGSIVETPFDSIVLNDSHGSDYILTKEWPLSNFPTRVVKRSGHIAWNCSSSSYNFQLLDTDGPFTIPEANCSPVATEPSTWGKIKALYR